MLNTDILRKNFTYLSIMPTFIFIFGVSIIYFFVTEEYSMGFIFLMISFLLYGINNIIDKNLEEISKFNQYLEDMSTFFTFGLTTIIFGFIFYKESLSILIMVFLYSVCVLLSLARNSILDVKNSSGFPIALNGVFFPFAYFLYRFYLQGPGESFFLIYYFIVSFLLLSKRNFLKLS